MCRHDYTHLRQAQTAALQLPSVRMATAIDLGDMKSPNGGIHPRLKQVCRCAALRLRCAALSILSFSLSTSLLACPDHIIIMILSVHRRLVAVSR